MTPEELDERIADLQIEVYGDVEFGLEINDDEKIKQLIRDVVAAVTPEKSTTRELDEAPMSEFAGRLGFNQAIDTIEQNTKELLGEK